MEYNCKGREFRYNMYFMRDACDFAGLGTKYSNVGTGGFRDGCICRIF